MKAPVKLEIGSRITLTLDTRSSVISWKQLREWQQEARSVIADHAASHGAQLAPRLRWQLTHDQLSNVVTVRVYGRVAGWLP